jgi:endonuclease IV
LFVDIIPIQSMNYAKAGFHVSIAGGISNSVDNALKIGCNAFQIFSRNPRGWTAKPLEEDREKCTSNIAISYAATNTCPNTITRETPNTESICSGGRKFERKYTR